MRNYFTTRWGFNQINNLSKIRKMRSKCHFLKCANKMKIKIKFATREFLIS